MTAVNSRLYNLLKSELKLSDEKAKEFAEALKEEVINDIKNHNQDFKSSMNEDFLKIEFKIENTKSELLLKMEQNKSDLLKWFIGAFLALALMTIGLYIK